jgi:hypothetical protein
MHPAYGDWDDYGEYLERLAAEALTESLSERASDAARLAEMEAARECGPDELYPW